MEVEEAIASLGKVGRWQATYFLVLSSCKNIMMAFHMVSILWIGHTPEHHCKVSEGVPINDSIPRDSNGKLSQCLKYVNLSLSNQTMACDQGWTYDPHDSYTIVNQWDLVCSYEIYSQLPQTILVVGIMVGAFVTSIFSDKYGRKPVFLISQIGIMILGIVCVFVGNFYAFLLCKFVTGIFLQGIGLSGFILISELFAGKQRTFAGVCEKCFLGLFLGVLALLAYLLPNWVHFQLAISLPGVFNIPLFWFLSESVPWLYANGRVDEAETAIRKAAKINKIKMPDVILLRKTDDSLQKKDPIKTLAINSNQQEVSNEKNNQNIKHTYTILDLLKSRTLLLYLVVSSFICIVVTMVFFGLQLTSGNLEGNRFLNGFYNGIIEVPADIVAYFVITIFGRKKIFFIFIALAGLSLVIIPFIPHATPGGTDLSVLPMISSNIGMFFITACYAILFLYLAEIFPTNLRNRALGIAFFFGRIGTLLATFAKYLFSRNPSIPRFVFGGLCFLTALSVLFLPETRNRPLPKTIEEIENWSRKEVKDPNVEQEESNIQNISSF